MPEQSLYWHMNDQLDSALWDLFDPIGLCATCCHVRIVQSSHRSTFYLCQLADVDLRFARYPHLPVLKCAGYELPMNNEVENP
jgi:hypothetical protein